MTSILIASTVIAVSAVLLFLFQQDTVHKPLASALWALIIAMVALAFFSAIEARDFLLVSIFAAAAFVFCALPPLILGLISFFFVKEKHERQVGKKFLRAGGVCVMLIGIALLANRALWLTKLAATGGQDMTRAVLYLQ